MRTATYTHFLILFAVVFSIAIGPILLFFLAPTYLLNFTKISYFFAALALFFILTPLGKIRLTARDSTPLPEYSFLGWLGQIVAAEISLTALTVSLLHTGLTYIPYETTHLPTWPFSLHPWPLLALLSVGLGYSYFCAHQPPLLSSLLPAPRNKYWDTLLRRVLQSTINIPIYFFLAAAIALGGLQISALFTEFLHHDNQYQLTSVTFFVGALLLIAVHAKRSQEFVRKIARKKIAFGWLLFIFMILLGALFTLQNSLVSEKALPLAPEFKLSPTLRSVIVWSAWLGFVPFFSTWIARVSAGKSIRSVIGAVLFLPCMSAIVLSFVKISITDSLALTGPLCIIWFLRKAYDSTYLIVGWMPYDKENRLMNRQRTAQFILPVLKGITIVAVGYVWFGLKVVGLGMMMAVFLAVGVLGVGLLAWVGRMQKKSLDGA